MRILRGGETFGIRPADPACAKTAKVCDITADSSEDRTAKWDATESGDRIPDSQMCRLIGLSTYMPILWDDS